MVQSTLSIFTQSREPEQKAIINGNRRQKAWYLIQMEIEFELEPMWKLESTSPLTGYLTLSNQKDVD